MKRIFFIFSCLLVLLICSYVLFKPQSYQTSLFSWDTEPILPENRTQLWQTMETLKIKTLYQTFPENSLPEPIYQDFSQEAKKKVIRFMP